MRGEAIFRNDSQRHYASRAEAFSCFTIAAIFYHLFLTQNFSAAHDSMNYLNGIVEGKDLFHQHHLLYHAAARLYYLFLSQVFSQVPDYYLVESFSALWGAAGLTITYLIFRNRFKLKKSISIFGVLITGFSFGYWFYSTNVEVYMPPVCLILLCILLLTKTRLNTKQVLVIALIHAAAILFHQVNILFTIVSIATLFLQRHADSISLKDILLYCLVAGAVVLGFYIVIGFSLEQNDSLASWIDWMRGYTHGHDYWKPLGLKTPLAAAIGFSHALLGGHFFFQLPFTAEILSGSLTDHGLQDEIFLSSNISSPVSILLLAGSVILALIILMLLIHFFRSIKKSFREQQGLYLPIILSLLVYSVFFLFWMPEILEFWILQSVLCWLLLIGITGTQRLKPVQVSMIPLLAVLMFAVNYYGSIRWLSSSRFDWYNYQVNLIGAKLQPNDLVIVEDPWILGDYFRYHYKIKVIEAGREDANALNTLPDRGAKNGTVYIILNGRSEEGRTQLRNYLLSLPNKPRLLEREPEIWVID